MEIILYIIAGLAGLIVLGIGSIALVGAFLPRRHETTRSATIDATIEQVWDLLTDPERQSAWRTNVADAEVATAEANEKRRWIESYESGQEVSMKTLEHEAPRLLVRQIEEEGPFAGHWRYELQEESGGATRVTVTETGEMPNVIFRFFAKFFIGHDTFIKIYLRDLEQYFAEDAEDATDGATAREV